jgi:hypothetical protein
MKNQLAITTPYLTRQYGGQSGKSRSKIRASWTGNERHPRASRKAMTDGVGSGRFSEESEARRGKSSANTMLKHKMFSTG